MSEKYIRENQNYCNIVKNSKIYAKITNLDDAIFVRDLLIDNDWDLDKIPQTIKYDDNYLVLVILDDKIQLLAKCKTEPSQKTIDKLIKNRIRNPNNSKYGLNISKVFDTFVIKKQIAGDDYIFGYYDNLEDAQFVRNYLLECSWNVSEFELINYCDESDKYKLTKVIDDKVYVLDSSEENNFDLDKSYGKFLAKISKHKYGLASYPHLDDLKDKIDDLEKDFGVKTTDDMWSFDNIDESKSPLNQIIFNLTPFEKSVYDAINGKTSFDDIKKALIRYKSGNFEDKINKNLDRLVEKGLVRKTDDKYEKTNF